jgi:hypothetical protein
MEEPLPNACCDQQAAATELHFERHTPSLKPRSKNKVISLPFRIAASVASTTAGALKVGVWLDIDQELMSTLPTFEGEMCAYIKTFFSA